MYDFSEVSAASKSEQVRAWAVEQAIQSFGCIIKLDDAVTTRAAEIEKFVLEGGKTDG